MKSHRVLAMAAMAAALAGPAFATVNVRLDQNALLDLRAPAGTVLVGNPAIADVNLVTPRRIAILGRGFGQTNVIVTDRLGRVIFSQVVAVSQAGGDVVSVHRGAAATSFVCSPACTSAPAGGAASITPAQMVAAQPAGSPAVQASGPLVATSAQAGSLASPPPLPQ